jgi:hypothetical protein
MSSILYVLNICEKSGFNSNILGNFLSSPFLSKRYKSTKPELREIFSSKKSKSPQNRYLEKFSLKKSTSPQNWDLEKCSLEKRTSPQNRDLEKFFLKKSTSPHNLNLEKFSFKKNLSKIASQRSFTELGSHPALIQNKTVYINCNSPSPNCKKRVSLALTFNECVALIALQENL